VVLTVVPAEWPHPRQEHWKILNQARAIENQNFILAVNRVGVSENTHFCGNSMIIDPWGKILAQGGEEEAVIVAELDMSQVEQVRNTIPCWRDRRPDVYNA
jgi:predicted amidohydrolase